MGRASRRDTRVEVWPENWPAFEFFADQCSTQWRVGMRGPTGLDHTAVLADLDELDLSKADRRVLFADIRAMERAALGVMAQRDD